MDSHMDSGKPFGAVWTLHGSYMELVVDFLLQHLCGTEQSRCDIHRCRFNNAGEILDDGTDTRITYKEDRNRRIQTKPDIHRRLVVEGLQIKTT